MNNRTRKRSAIRLAGFFASLTPLLMSACAVGPDYRRPELPLPDTYSRGNSAVGPGQVDPGQMVESGQVNLAQWWTNFNDPELTGLVTQALDANLDLKQAIARLTQARAERRITLAGLFPQLGASADFTRRGSTGERVTGEAIADAADSSSGRSSSVRNVYQAGFDASWEIDVFGGLRRGVEAASAEVEAAQASLNDVRISLAAEVASTYFDLREAQAQVAITEANLESQTRSAKLTQERFQSGLASGLDTANASAAVSSTQARLPQQKTAVERAIQNLSLLLGREPNALTAALRNPQPLPEPPAALSAGLPSELLLRRPDIRAAEAALHAATARVGVATADYFPRFSLTGSFVYNGGSISTLLDGDSRTWVFGPGIQWSIFEAGRVQANVEAQRAALEQAFAAYELSILTALRDVESALSGVSATKLRQDSLVEAEAQNAKAVELSRQLYTAGMSDFLEVLLAQRALYATQDAVIQSRRLALSDVVALYKSLGGGWETAEK